MTVDVEVEELWPSLFKKSTGGNPNCGATQPKRSWRLHKPHPNRGKGEDSTTRPNS